MIDLDAVAAAAAERTAQRVLDQLPSIIRGELQRRDEDKLLPLAAILGCSSKAATTRLSRDGELRALGLRVGRRLLFRRAEVEAFLAQRTRGGRG